MQVARITSHAPFLLLSVENSPQNIRVAGCLRQINVALRATEGVHPLRSLLPNPPPFSEPAFMLKPTQPQPKPTFAASNSRQAGLAHFVSLHIGLLGKQHLFCAEFSWAFAVYKLVALKTAAFPAAFAGASLHKVVCQTGAQRATHRTVCGKMQASNRPVLGDLLRHLDHVAVDRWVFDLGRVKQRTQGVSDSERLSGMSAGQRAMLRRRNNRHHVGRILHRPWALKGLFKSQSDIEENASTKFSSS